MLQTGFARMDITPHLGISLRGQYFARYADGMLDPLLGTGIAFSDGENSAVLMSLDLIGIPQLLQDRLRQTVADYLKLPKEAIFIACTHTHQGPATSEETGRIVEPEYVDWLEKRLCDIAYLAMQDLAPTTLSYTHGKAEDVAFIRRYRMKDGRAKTNPGWQNPDILHPIGTPDEESTLLILKREGKPEIGIVNFQVHPDVIGGTKFSADYPKFVRDTYEANVPNSLCMYINGAQGDTNHVDVRLGPDQLRGGYERAKYMGRKIAMSVISNYALAQPLTGKKVRFGQSELRCRYNKGKPEEMEDALWLYDYYKKVGHKVAGAAAKEKGILSVPAAVRIYNLKDEPDERDLHITALAVGDAVIAGFPGEPFTEIGRSVKKHSPFTVTLTACAANSYEDYFPMQDCFDEGGYETESTLYTAGTAERMIEASLDLINTLI